MMTYKNRQTIYYLCDDVWDILYIGKSVSTVNRITNHSGDKNKEEWWTDVSFIHIEHIPDQVDLNEAEKHRIRTLNPKYNKQRFNGSRPSQDYGVERNPGNLRQLVSYESECSLENAVKIAKSILDWTDQSRDLRESVYDLLLLQREQAMRLLAKHEDEMRRLAASSHEHLELWLQDVGAINWAILELLDKTSRYESLDVNVLSHDFEETLKTIKDVFAKMRARPSHWEVLELPSTRGSKILQDAMAQGRTLRLELAMNEYEVGAIRRCVEMWNTKI